MKQSRNEICNCGSKKKFKNCCMSKTDNNFIKKYYIQVGISLFVLLFLWLGVDRFVANQANLARCEEIKNNGPDENQKGFEWCDDCCAWKRPGHNANKK